jgi:hypothetical protein
MILASASGNSLLQQEISTGLLTLLRICAPFSAIFLKLVSPFTWPPA